jgi:hypothetical protein
VGIVAAYELDSSAADTNQAADSGPDALHGEWSGTTTDDGSVCAADGTCETSCAAGSSSTAGVDIEFYFGTGIPESAGSGAQNDDGTGYTAEKGYGWDCEGDTDVDYSGGRRGVGRDNGLGINHFDRNNQCKQPDGSAYGRVNWSIDVPNGVYTNVEVYNRVDLSLRWSLRS